MKPTAVKVYKIEVMVVDLQKIGESAIRDAIQNAPYDNHCIWPEVRAVESRDIEWTDKHPLNHPDQSDAEYHRLFDPILMVQDGSPNPRPTTMETLQTNIDTAIAALMRAANEEYANTIIDRRVEPLVIGPGKQWESKQAWLDATVERWLRPDGDPAPSVVPLRFGVGANVVVRKPREPERRGRIAGETPNGKAWYVEMTTANGITGGSVDKAFVSPA
jgi:hypothetical protein